MDGYKIIEYKKQKRLICTCCDKKSIHCVISYEFSMTTTLSMMEVVVDMLSYEGIASIIAFSKNRSLMEELIE